MKYIMIYSYCLIHDKVKLGKKLFPALTLIILSAILAEFPRGHILLLWIYKLLVSVRLMKILPHLFQVLKQSEIDYLHVYFFQ